MTSLLTYFRCRAKHSSLDNDAFMPFLLCVPLRMQGGVPSTHVALVHIWPNESGARSQGRRRRLSKGVADGGGEGGGVLTPTFENRRVDPRTFYNVIFFLRAKL